MATFFLTYTTLYCCKALILESFSQTNHQSRRGRTHCINNWRKCITIVSFTFTSVFSSNKRHTCKLPKLHQLYYDIILVPHFSKTVIGGSQKQDRNSGCLPLSFAPAPSRASWSDSGVWGLCSSGRTPASAEQAGEPPPQPESAAVFLCAWTDAPASLL